MTTALPLGMHVPDAPEPIRFVRFPDGAIYLLETLGQVDRARKALYRQDLLQLPINTARDLEGLQSPKTGLLVDENFLFAAPTLFYDWREITLTNADDGDVWEPRGSFVERIAKSTSPEKTARRLCRMNPSAGDWRNNNEPRRDG